MEDNFQSDENQTAKKQRKKDPNGNILDAESNNAAGKNAATQKKTGGNAKGKDALKKEARFKRIKNCVAFLLIGIVAAVCGVFTAKYLNSDAWKNRGNAKEADSLHVPSAPAIPKEPAALSDPSYRADVLASLEQCLQKWTAAWRAGDMRAFWEPIFFFEAKENQGQTLPGNRIPISDEDFNQQLFDAFGNLMEKQADEEEKPETAKTLTQSILPYLDISYALPQDPASPFQVEFQITGPDMLQLLEAFQEESDPDRLLAGIQQSLKGGAYLKKTSIVAVGIIQMENGWRLADSYELADALYGGLLTIYRDSVAAAYHELLPQLGLEMEEVENE